MIGAGRIATNHARILAQSDAVEALLVADVVAARADALASKHPIVESADIDSLFRQTDAVIASSTDTHAGMLERAAAAGVDAFCEKPIDLDLDLDRTRQAVAAVDAAGITVQMCFQRRYDPAMHSIRDRIESGDLETPYLVRSQTHDPEPPPLDYISHSGGMFKDCLIHDIDVVRYVTGQEVESVRATGSALGHPDIAALSDVGSVAALFEMSKGTIAQLSGLRLDPVGYDVRLEVSAPNGAVAASWSDRTPIDSAEPGVAAPSNPTVSFEDRFAAAYQAELHAFLRVVRGEEAPASNHHDAYEDLRVAEACDLSMRDARTVPMAEIPR